jgi:membrane protein
VDAWQHVQPSRTKGPCGLTGRKERAGPLKKAHETAWKAIRAHYFSDSPNDEAPSIHRGRGGFVVDPCFAAGVDTGVPAGVRCAVTITFFDTREMNNGILGYAERLARRYPLRVGETRLSLLTIRIVQRFLEVRVMGLAAEMTYYALVSVFPLIGALGASLGFLERLVGPAAVEEIEATILFSLATVFSAEVADQVIAPMVQGLLQQERTGFAIGGFVVSLFLASRVFRSAIHTLDEAYSVEERRGVVALWTLGFVFALGAIVTAVAVLSLVVVGPLLGGGHALAERLGFGRAFATAWAIARWPTVFAIGIAFLAVLYRSGPNVRNTWRQSLPGAVFGMVGLVLVAVAFRVYLEFTGLASPDIRDADEAVAVGAQVVGAVLAALLWLWLSGTALLTGGVVNAELSREHHDLPPPQE